MAVIALTVIFGGLTLASTPASASTGAVVAPASSCHGPADFGAVYLGATWPGGFKGVPVYSNGISGSFTDCLHSTRTPEGRVVTDGYEWQCVELVDRLYLTKGWIESSWLGNGNQMFATAPSFLRRQGQGHIAFVHPGDVISFNAPGGGAGHAAVVARVQGSYLTIVNQNTGRAATLSNAYLRGGRIEMVGWAGWAPIGVVHAPVKVAAPLAITHTVLSSTVVNDGYVRPLATSGGLGRKQWQVTAGTPPLGVGVTPTGQVSGIAMTTGGYAFAATVRDSIGQTASEQLRMHVSTDGNLLRDAYFSTSRLEGWHLAPLGKTDVMHARSTSGLRHLPSGRSDVELSSSSPGGSLYQDVATASTPGDSYTFSAWVRGQPVSASSSGASGTSVPAAAASPVRVCLELVGLSANGGAGARTIGHGVTCRAISSSWSHLVVPYDVNGVNAGGLAAHIVVESARGAVDVTATRLEGNGLQHAGFAQNHTSGWTLLPPSRAATSRVNGQAYAAAPGLLPTGTNYFQMNTARSGGSMLQDVNGVLPRGQGFELTTWVRAAGTGAHVNVCLVLWGLGHVRSASHCARVGSTWSEVTVRYRVATTGERDLRAQLYLDSVRKNVDVNGISLVNSAG